MTFSSAWKVIRLLPLVLPVFGLATSLELGCGHKSSNDVGAVTGDQTANPNGGYNPYGYGYDPYGYDPGDPYGYDPGDPYGYGR
jgi:hypothetical protein